MSISEDDFMLALAHYRVEFPTLASLGSGSPPEAWNVERLRVGSEGLSATLITQNSYEGGGASAQKNFDQRAVLRALLMRRAELDPAFDDLAFAPPAVKARARLGFVVRLGGC